jgi:UDP:flavonoid glycosyltransferase YjiC (YdhE family)
MREATLEVLGDSTYRQRAEAFGTEMASLPGPEHAVDLLERLAAGRVGSAHAVAGSQP